MVLGKRQAWKPTKGHNVLASGEGNGSLCLPSIARMEKSKAKHKEIAALQRACRRLDDLPSARPPAQRGRCERGLLTG
jgi:hypothetical protein